MARLLDQSDGLALYGRHLLRHLIGQNPRNYPWWDNILIRVMLPLHCHKARVGLAISQAGLDRATRFGWPQAARRVLECFDRALGAPSVQARTAALGR